MLTRQLTLPVQVCSVHRVPLEEFMSEPSRKQLAAKIVKLRGYRVDWSRSRIRYVRAKDLD